MVIFRPTRLFTSRSKHSVKGWILGTISKGGSLKLSYALCKTLVDEYIVCIIYDISVNLQGRANLSVCTFRKGSAYFEFPAAVVALNEYHSKGAARWSHMRFKTVVSFLKSPCVSYYDLNSTLNSFLPTPAAALACTRL